jgi:hypothetical protein
MNYYLYLVISLVVSFVGLKIVLKQKEKNPKSKLGLVYILLTPILIYCAKYFPVEVATLKETIQKPLTEVSSSVASIYPMSSI